MTSILAAVCREHGAPLSIETLDLRGPEGREVEVTVSAVAICHSDISYAEGSFGGPVPALFGHEAAGHVSALGPEVRGLRVGDAVLVTLIRSCGHCSSCASGHPVICKTPGGISPLTDEAGASVFQAMSCGAFAERVVVDQSQIAAIPPDLPMTSACLLSCGVITGLGAVVNTADLRPGQDVVVIGAGGVGLNAIQGARLAGARRIVAVDMSEDKLADAREFGATDGILATDDDPQGELRRILGAGADLCIVTVGAIEAYEQAPLFIGPNGRMIMVGMPHVDARSTLDPGRMAYLGQGAIGSKMGDVVLARDIPWMVDLYRQGRLKLDELVSAIWPLDRINDAIDDTRSGAARRNVVVF